MKAKSQLKPIHKLFLFGVGALFLMLGAQLAHEYFARPQWLKESDVACKSFMDDPRGAEEHFKTSMKLAEQAKDLDAQYCQTIYWYSWFLFINQRYHEMRDISARGLAFAGSIKARAWESRFLTCLASADHYLYRNGDIEKPDKELIRKAAEIGCQNDDVEAFYFEEQYTYGQICRDYLEYAEANEHLEKALAEAVRIRSQSSEFVAQSELAAVLIDQNKYKEANKKIVDLLSRTKFATRVRDIYREIWMSKELQDAKIFPQGRRLLAKKDFAALNELVSQAAGAKETFANGKDHLTALYDTFDLLQKEEPDQLWSEHIDTLKQWRKDTSSDYPLIGLADAYTSYAWKARGNGYANSVSDDGWKHFENRLNEAQNALKQAKIKPQFWFMTQQTVALGQNWQRARYEELVCEGLKKYPQCVGIIADKFWWLQPQWNGEEGEGYAFIDEECAKLNKTEGDMLYARLAWNRDMFNGDVFRHTKMKWPRVKSGMLSLIKKYPQSNYARAELALMAMSAGDKATAEAAFDR